MHSRLILFTFWLIATGTNLNKAVHIDDTAHLLIAKHIIQDPGHPMSGELFWGVSKREKIHRTNQPHLIPYYLAIWLKLFGESDWILHLSMSIFSLIAIFAFYRLTQLILEANRLIISAMFCLGPVFIPSQNLMTDIPLTAFWLQFMVCLLTPDSVPNLNRRLTFASLLAGLAILTKYNGIMLISILAILVYMKYGWKKLWVISIALGMLLLWSWFNYIDYGGIHFLEREVKSINYIERIKSWLICLGSISPFSFIALPFFLMHPQRCLLIMVGSLIAIAYAHLEMNHYMAESQIQSFLRILFFMNGTLTIFMVLLFLIFFGDQHQNLKSNKVTLRILIIWLLTAGGFILICSPFIAVRHFLPIIPVVLLSFGMMVELYKSNLLIRTGLVITVFLGLLLAASDWQLANIYRDKAQTISRELRQHSGVIWFVGHWGWQWYASKAGMQMYESKVSNLQPNDIVVIPEQVDKQRMSKKNDTELINITIDVVPSTIITLLRTMNYQKGYYSSNVQNLPWTITNMPLETFRIVRVVKQK